MTQSARLEFQSTAFPIEPGEDERTNPGIYGTNLAQWLASKLRERAVTADDPIPEDFGWCIPVASSPHQLYVACANAEDVKEGWRVYVFAEGGLLARFRGHDERTPMVVNLFAAVKAVLESSPEVQNLREEPR